ncbi:hypothetical protein CO615_04580 [Lysobacteraceae bacterium NML75-0749]|nr:hypothetical protein CO615_04580 [Xanthomonadaceae bacterium NML75-0749]
MNTARKTKPAQPIANPALETFADTLDAIARNPEAANCADIRCLVDAMSSLEHGAEALENLMHLMCIGQLMEADEQAEAALMTVAKHYVAPYIRILRCDAQMVRQCLSDMGVQV